VDKRNRFLHRNLGKKITGSSEHTVGPERHLPCTCSMQENYSRALCMEILKPGVPEVKRNILTYK